MDQRLWNHGELGDGKPSAAAARLGCRCGECRTALRDYLAAYKQRQVPIQANEDGTALYHTHKGQPSSRTARGWGCAHPRCLYLAGLYLDDEYVVRRRVDDEVDPEFGATPATPVV